MGIYGRNRRNAPRIVNRVVSPVIVRERFIRIKQEKQRRPRLQQYVAIWYAINQIYA
jgi:hypothetical protein